MGGGTLLSLRCSQGESSISRLHVGPLWESLNGGAPARAVAGWGGGESAHIHPWEVMRPWKNTFLNRQRWGDCGLTRRLEPRLTPQSRAHAHHAHHMQALLPASLKRWNWKASPTPCVQVARATLKVRGGVGSKGDPFRLTGPLFSEKITI